MADGVIEGVLEAVAPKEREGVGVCVGVGVWVGVLERVTAVLEGVGVTLGVGVGEGAATREKDAELRVYVPLEPCTLMAAM